MKPEEEFLSIFDRTTPSSVPFGAQILDCKIEALQEANEDDAHFLYCLAAVGRNIITVLNIMVCPNDWSDKEEEDALWQQALKKIGWKIDVPDNRLPQNISLSLYDFHAKTILILEIVSATDGVGFDKYNAPDLISPQNLWDLLESPTGNIKESKPNEAEKRFMIGTFQTLMRMVDESRPDIQEAKIIDDRLLLTE